jgi:glutamate synthase domain-containing protein 3
MGQITLVENSMVNVGMERITTDNGSVRIDADGLFYKDLNKLLRDAVLDYQPEKISLHNVYGQRYIGTNLRQPIKLEVFGTPGNDLGAFMDGPAIEVFGNAQDGCGNTMNSGEIIVHGNAGDIAGFSARGGEMFIKGDVGYRVGIHMKEYKDKKPALVIGGTAQDFLGEYMAGGVLIILGLPGRNGSDRHTADFIGTGMHGGVIYIRGKVEDHQLGKEVSQVQLDENDRRVVEKYVCKFTKYFDYDAEGILSAEFTKLLPLSHRPYGRLYAY